MGILSVKVDEIGETNVRPQIARISTNDTLATVSASGYLSKVAKQFSLSEDMMVLVSTKTSPNATSTQVAWMEISKSGDVWSLVPSESTLPLTDGQILVGNASNVATDVAMSGDVAINNAGVTTIQANAIETAMITDLNVTTAKLAANAVTSAKVDATLMQYATVSISAAQFNGMYAAPVVLVAAAGADTLITLHRAELLMTYNSAQYANGGAVAIQYDSTINGAGIIASTTQDAADFADAASTANAFEGGIVKQPFATCVNKGLYLSNITGAFDTGDSDFVMHIWYSVIPTV